MWVSYPLNPVVGGLSGRGPPPLPLARGPNVRPRLMRTAILLGMYLNPSDFEIKPGKAQLVLTWETTWEHWVLYAFLLGGNRTLGDNGFEGSWPIGLHKVVLTHCSFHGKERIYTKKNGTKKVYPCMACARQNTWSEPFDAHECWHTQCALRGGF